MPLALVPILAQAVALGLSNRTEGRYIAAQERHAEASTGVSTLLRLTWPRAEVSFGYGPSITVTPLETKPRDVLLFHRATLSASYRWRKTTLLLTENAGYGELNLQLVGVRTAPTIPGADGSIPGGTGEPAAGDPTMPTTGGGTTTPGTGTSGMQGGDANGAPTQTRTVNRSVSYVTSTTVLSLGHRVSRHVTIVSQAGFSLAGGVGEEGKRYYPLARGWFVGVTGDYVYRISARDALLTQASLQHAWADGGGRAGTLLATERWAHVISAQTSTSLGAGVSALRFKQANEPAAYDVFPTFNASITHDVAVSRGVLTLGLSVYAAPVLDTLRATVDPRLGAGASVGYRQGRFAAIANAGAGLSVAGSDNQAGAINSVDGSLLARYFVSSFVSLDGGAQAAWATLRGATLIPPSWAGFVGVTFGHEFALTRPR